MLSYVFTKGAIIMPLKTIILENFTVFEKTRIDFCDGINVFIGENGTGKTHIMKLLYAACQAAQAKTTAVDFPQKIVKLFRPDDLNIGRLVQRKSGNLNSKVSISSDINTITVSFDRRTSRWNWSPMSTLSRSNEAVTVGYPVSCAHRATRGRLIVNSETNTKRTISAGKFFVIRNS